MNGALNSLRFFSGSGWRICATGSQLGVATRKRKLPFPSGVRQETMHPMSFEEFLWALGEEQMADAVRAHADTLETYAAHQAALNLFHRYQIVGGMPAAVNAYRKTLSIEDARVEQREIDETYTADMTDPENGISGVAARKVWRSIPSQLLRSSTKKFKYSEVERGGRRSKLIEPLDWLEGAGIISVNNLTEGIEPPLVPFDDEDGSFFKVYLLDTGLMFYKLGINPRLWLDLKEDSAIALSSDFRGALAENSVMQAFSGNGLQTYYWMPPSSWKTNGELDFLLQTDRMEIVPVEVKSARNVRARTLGSFMEKAGRRMPTYCPRTILPAAKPMTDASCAISPCTQRALSEQTASRAVCNPRATAQKGTIICSTYCLFATGTSDSKDKPPHK